MNPTETTQKLLDAITPEFSTLKGFAEFLGDSYETWKKKLTHPDRNPSLNVRSIISIIQKLGLVRFLQIIAILAEKDFDLKIDFKISSTDPLTSVKYYRYNEGNEKNTGENRK